MVRLFDEGGNSPTIAAVSTPPGEGGVGIIRISGPDALKNALRVFRLKKVTPSVPLKNRIKERFLHYGEIVEQGGLNPSNGDAAFVEGGYNPIDDGFLVYMKAPASYTGLDVVELHCHGGMLILKKTLAALVRAGCVLAGPGEFTKQAFLNGKLDLAQAEAVIDVIRAETDAALVSARGRKGGAFTRRVNAIKEALTDSLAHVEATLDFPEDEIPRLDNLRSQTDEAARLLRALIATFEEGRALKNGVRVLILGRPNVGKSSLLNILLQEERAIVTPVPGTTRDMLEETVNIRGVPIRLIDTAGLRDTLDPVESIGVRLAKERVKDADLILYIFDVNADTEESNSLSADKELLKITEGKKLIVIGNKIDLLAGEKLTGRVLPLSAEKAFDGKRLVFICCTTGEGVEGLKDAIYELSVGHPMKAAAVAALGELTVTLRNKESLEAALESVTRALSAVDENLPAEFIAVDLKRAVDRLGEITGETVTEDILDRIFNSFCIGK